MAHGMSVEFQPAEPSFLEFVLEFAVPSAAVSVAEFVLPYLRATSCPLAESFVLFVAQIALEILPVFLPQNPLTTCPLALTFECKIEF